MSLVLEIIERMLLISVIRADIRYHQIEGWNVLARISGKEAMLLCYRSKDDEMKSIALKREYKYENGKLKVIETNFNTVSKWE